MISVIYYSRIFFLLFHENSASLIQNAIHHLQMPFPVAGASGNRPQAWAGGGPLAGGPPQAAAGTVPGAWKARSRLVCLRLGDTGLLSLLVALVVPGGRISCSTRLYSEC